MIEAIVQRALPGCTVGRMWPLKGGIIAEMTAVEVEMAAGEMRTVVVRQHETAVYTYKLLQLTRRLGLPTPLPIYLDPLADPAALVMDYVAGAIDFGAADRDGYVGQMAAQLAAIHALDLSAEDVSFLTVRQSGCFEVGRVSGASRAAGFDVGRVERVLGERPLQSRNRVALLHGDFWAGNMLWHKGDLAAVIDWEDAALGEPLKDLAEARVEIVWLFGAAAADLFLEHYRAGVEIDYRDLAYWDLCAVLRLWRLTSGDWGWLVDFAGEYGRDDITAVDIGRYYGEFVAQALEKMI